MLPPACGIEDWGKDQEVSAVCEINSDWEAKALSAVGSFVSKESLRSLGNSERQ